MSGALDGKVAAVTGATSGIGQATAVALAGAGAKVALAGRREDRLTALAERIEGDGGRALAVPTDVGDEAQASAFVQRAHDELGGLDILINNAGVMLLGPVMGANTDEWREMINANCFGVLYCTHAALPLLAEAGGGDILNVSSVAGRQASLGSAVYNMTKWGVNGFTEGLRQEALHAGIRVSVVEPGMVETELLDHNSNPMVLEAAKKMREQVGTPLSADDIARLILFIVSQPEHVAVNEALIRPTRQTR
ncbi:MAG TPA: SDR family NAD(P)-dependent oxidoreductase [Solirubrobacteraceae bacterium]|jgi:NADP-dependent 3-hydroxy acid dehydrogenase YdfG|nr:SDR family NAD(P)-dependent oxidoreductase [Solirubrobacteraceae bacterium]